MTLPSMPVHVTEIPALARVSSVIATELGALAAHAAGVNAHSASKARNDATRITEPARSVETPVGRSEDPPRGNPSVLPDIIEAIDSPLEKGLEAFDRLVHALFKLPLCF